MDARFVTSLDMRKIGAQRWLLLDDLVFQSVELNGLLIAPRGFQTDLASIPRALWAVFPKEDVYDQAAVIHDGAYGHALLTRGQQRVEVVKPVADRLFYEAMLACGFGKVRAQLLYRAVSLFGNPAAHPLADNQLEWAHKVGVE